MKLSRIQAVFILFVVMTIDFSGDSILRAFPNDASIRGLDMYGKTLISGIMALFLLAYGLKIPARLDLMLPFFMILGVIAFGLFHGIYSNNINHAINETIPFLFFLSFLGFAGGEPITTLEIEKFLKIFVYVIVLKIIIYTFAAYSYFGFVSWKVLLKQSPLLLIPLSVYFSKIVSKTSNTETYFLLLLVLFGIVFAMARMLILATIFLWIAYFLNRRIISSLKFLTIMTFVFIAYFSFMGESATDVISFIYGGEVYQYGMDYRLEQLGIIMDRYRESPLLGVGFGYYTPGYLTYGMLAKPYLLELDILNFISKIGLIGTLIYAFSYFWLFLLIKKIANHDVRVTAMALFLALCGLLIYSLGQTGHQSYVYWVYLAFVYGFVVSHLRAQIRTSIFV